MNGVEKSNVDGSALRGIGLMSLAMLIIPGMDIVAKYLSTTIVPLEIAFARFLFQSLFATILILVGPGLITLRVSHLAPQFLRGLFLAIATFLFFSAVKYMPVANAIAIFFVEPMILTALSAIFLRETVGIRRWSAVFVGFIGALFILRPGVSDFGWHAVLPLGTALFFALYLIVTRRLSGSDSMFAIQFYTGISGTLFLGLLLLLGSVADADGFVATIPTTFELSLMASMGLFSFVCHGLIVLAFAHAPAVVLAPLNYLEIVSATILGYIVFGNFPDSYTWIGIAIIISCGIYIAHRARIRS